METNRGFYTLAEIRASTGRSMEGLRALCRRAKQGTSHRLAPHEVERAGNMWLIKKKAAEREFGEIHPDKTQER